MSEADRMVQHAIHHVDRHLLEQRAASSSGSRGWWMNTGVTTSARDTNTSSMFEARDNDDNDDNDDDDDNDTLS